MGLQNKSLNLESPIWYLDPLGWRERGSRFCKTQPVLRRAKLGANFSVSHNKRVKAPKGPSFWCGSACTLCFGILGPLFLAFCRSWEVWSLTGADGQRHDDSDSMSIRIYGLKGLPVGSRQAPFFGCPDLGLGFCNHKVGYPKKGVWYEPRGRGNPKNIVVNVMEIYLPVSQSIMYLLYSSCILGVPHLASHYSPFTVWPPETTSTEGSYILVKRPKTRATQEIMPCWILMFLSSPGAVMQQPRTVGTST